jgi:hypothetical protein
MGLIDAASHDEPHDRKPSTFSPGVHVMTTTRIVSASILFASLALTAAAQAQPAAGASSPAMATMSHDCAKPMAKHDHAAEKGNPKPASMSEDCASAKAKSTKATAAEKKRLAHIHAKDGKLPD